MNKRKVQQVSFPLLITFLPPHPCPESPSLGLRMYPNLNILYSFKKNTLSYPFILSQEKHITRKIRAFYFGSIHLNPVTLLSHINGTLKNSQNDFLKSETRPSTRMAFSQDLGIPLTSISKGQLQDSPLMKLWVMKNPVSCKDKMQAK